MNNDKRNRASNFCKEEVELLMELVCNYKNIIENKKTDAVTNTEKDLAWQKITGTFNAASGAITRSKKSLKLKYEGIKKQTKKKACHYRQSLYGTGGGPSTAPDFTKVEEKVLGICSNITGLDSRYDSDTITVPESPKPMETNTDTKEQMIEANEKIIIVYGDERGSEEEKIKLKNVNETDVNMDSKDTSAADGIKLYTLTTNCKNDKNDEEIIISNKWKKWTPKALKGQKHNALKTPNKASVTATLEKLTESRLELIELQKELARKEFLYKKQEHELCLQLMLNEDERKQEIHDLTKINKF